MSTDPDSEVLYLAWECTQLTKSQNWVILMAIYYHQILSKCV